MTDIVGVILAGGRARRMGGEDKCLKVIAGTTLVDHVLNRLRPQCSALVLSANGDPRRFAAYSMPIVQDDVPGLPGPLAGIVAGLDWTAAHVPDAHLAVTAAADTPFLPLDLVARLAEARQAKGAELACATSDGRLHPVFTLWPVSLRPELRRALVRGERRLADFVMRHNAALVDWPLEPYDPFFNINTPADFAAGAALAQRRLTG